MSRARRRQMRPREKGQVRPGAPFRVRVEQVIGARIVLIHAALHQPHPEHAGVEIEILLGWPGNRGDVVESGYGVHLKSSCSRFDTLMRLIDPRSRTREPASCMIDAPSGRDSQRQFRPTIRPRSARRPGGPRAERVMLGRCGTAPELQVRAPAPVTRPALFSCTARSRFFHGMSRDGFCGGGYPMASRPKVTQQKRARERARQERQQEKLRRRDEAKLRRANTPTAAERRRSRHRWHRPRATAEPVGRRRSCWMTRKTRWIRRG